MKYNLSDNESISLNSELVTKAFYEFSPLMYFMLDIEGKVLAVNPKGAIHLGYTEDELVGGSILEVFRESDHPTVVKQIWECLQKPDQIHRWETRKIKKDESIIWVNESAQVIKDRNNRYLIIIICEDITDQKYADFLVRTKNNVLEMIAGNEPLKLTLEMICNEIEGQADNMICTFLLPDKDGTRLTNGAGPSMPESYKNAVEGLEIGPGIACCGTAAFHKKQVIVEDIETDPLWADYRELARKHGFRACWSNPVLSSEGELLGTFAMYYNHTHVPRQFETNLMSTATHLARITIEHHKSRETVLNVTEALRESEDKYRILYDQSPVGVFIYDTNLTITGANERQAEILNSTCEKITGLDLRALKSQKFTPILEKSIEGKLGFMEGFYTATSGDAAVWLSVSTAPLRDREGRIIGGMGVVEDISERKQYEHALKESREQYMNLINSVDGIVWEADPERLDFTFVSPQAERILGYPSANWIGSQDFWINHIHEEDRKWVPEYCKKHISLLKDHQLEYRMVAADGNIVWIRELVSVISINGKLQGVRGILIDISEHKSMEDELLKAQKLDSLGTLAGGLAHDFNNLLTAIMGNISLLKSKTSSDKSIFKRLEEAEKASLRARDLTAQLLTFSKGGAPVKELVVSMEGLLVDTASFAVSGSSIKCAFDIDESLWPVEIDEGQISQVINNLVINAKQAMPEGGIVKICAENVSGFKPVTTDPDDTYNRQASSNDFIKISVIDSGMGIRKEHLSKIFDPYFTTKQEGNGLGLATSYSIIIKHNGHLNVESELGKGTTFKIYLPASESELTSGDIEPDQMFMGSGNILIMDDEEMVREIAGEMLSCMGYEVDFAKDGYEAIEKYKNAKKEGVPFDVVMMDLTVPDGMGGKEANANILTFDPNARTIVSSGYSNNSIMSEYIDYGFKAIATKPYNMEELSKVIHGVLNDNNTEQP